MNTSQVKHYVQQFCARIANYVITGAPTSKGLKDQVEGRAVGEDEEQYTLPVRRISGGFGFRSVPPKGSEGVILRINAGRRSIVLIATENLKYGPTDMAEGESAQFDMAGSVLRMSKDGSCTFTAKGGGSIVMDQDGNVTVDAKAGKDVSVNGGTHKVARVEDQVDGGHLVFAFTPAAGAVPGRVTITYVDGTGHAYPPIGFTVPGLVTTDVLTNFPLVGKIISGADHFKG